MLGGVEIPFDKGLQGHSDADVLLHAIIDALLGARADADIGTHFSDTSPEWRDVSSLELLGKVVASMHEGNWSVVNLDSTIILEAPRIGAYRESMRAAIAGALGIGSERVSIKAKTGERLGAEGRGEAISAQAVVLLQAVSRVGDDLIP